MKRAIVIGASSGIGFEVAQLLLSEGWKVGVASRRMELLQKVGNVEVAEQIDVNDPDASKQLREMINQMGGIDLFFYAAGVGKQNRDLKEDIELMTTTTNGLGFVRMIGEAFRYFLPAPRVWALHPHIQPRRPCRTSISRRSSSRPTHVD